MTTEKIKKEMLEWTDFYGGDLLNVDEVQTATTKEELRQILEKHRSHMEDMLGDAHADLDNFKKRLGLY